MSIAKLIGSSQQISNKNVLDKSIFNKTLNCAYLAVDPRKIDKKFRKDIVKYTLNLKNKKSLISQVIFKNYFFSAQVILKIIFYSIYISKKIAEEENKNIFIFDPHKFELSNFDENFQTLLDDNSLKISDIKTTKLTIDYDNWSHSEILDYLLPENCRVSAFTQIGHIAHVNLREEALKYKYIIGQVILDSSKAILTVLNKTDEIHSTYRYLF